MEHSEAESSRIRRPVAEVDFGRALQRKDMLNRVRRCS
jgi:hypothetical protein